MNRQNDPASIGDEQFWLLENVRLDGTGIHSRPGLDVAMDTGDSSKCIYGIWDERNPVPPVDSSFSSGAWFHNDGSIYRSTIADEVLPYFYAVQVKTTGAYGAAITAVRVKRFAKQVSGEPNFLLMDGATAAAPSSLWSVGASSLATAAITNAQLVSNTESAVNGEVVGGANITGTYSRLHTISARNGLVRFAVRLDSTGAMKFYVCDTTFHTVTLEATATLQAFGIALRDYFAQGAATLLVAYFAGGPNSRAYDYGTATETYPLPASPSDWSLNPDPSDTRINVVPRLIVGSSSFVPAIRSAPSAVNVGLYELSSGLVWTTRPYTTPAAYDRVFEAFVSGSDIYMIARVSGGSAGDLLKYSGGVWSVVGVTSGIDFDLVQHKSRFYNGAAWIAGKTAGGSARELFKSNAAFQAYTAQTALALSPTYGYALELVPE